MAETRLKVLSRQCLDRRIATIQQLSKQVRSWLGQRGKGQERTKWPFTTDDARIKLNRLYPAYYLGEPLVAMTGTLTKNAIPARKLGGKETGIRFAT